MQFTAWKTLLPTVLLAAGCASTKLANRWVAPEVSEKKVERVLVVGITGDEQRRETFEETFCDRLGQAGVEAVPSSKLTGEVTELTRTELESAVKRGEFDGVITTRLIDVEHETEYVPSSPMVYGGIYDQWGPGYYGAPVGGYLVETTTYKVETNIYRAEGTGELIWSGVSKTVDPSSRDKALNDIQQLVISEARKDGAL